jgi:hypothetical protein
MHADRYRCQEKEKRTYIPTHRHKILTCIQTFSETMEETLYHTTKSDELTLANEIKDQLSARLANAELLSGYMAKEAKKESVDGTVVGAKAK